ncbi:MAG TPA: hypothetical protein PLN65_09775, partial [Enterococcus sp.]|nr:hypothetical protein [Enterococcus sp.]
PQRQGKVDGEEALYQCLIGIGYGYFTSVWNKLFRRSSITKASGEILRFDESLAIGEDEVWLSSLLMKLRSIVLCPEPLYYWRQRETSVLHEIVIDQRWHSALKAKRIVLELVANSEKCRDMALGKVYDDLFHVLWYAYCCDDNEALAYFYDELRPFQKNFFDNKAFSFKKKIRYLALLFMITFRFPRRTVQALGEVTSIKLRLARQSNIKF